MLLPDATKQGDLRITNGIIAEIGDAGSLDNHDDEMFVDGTGLHLYLELSTRKFTFATRVSLKRRTWAVVQLLQLVAE